MLPRERIDMTFFIEIRSKFRKFLFEREVWVLRLLRFLLSLGALMMVNHTLGYQKYLNHWWVAVLVALLCMFIPLQGATVVVLFFIILHLLTLSTDVAVVALALLLIGYIVCGYFQSKDTHNFIFIPFCYQIHLPFVIPIGNGLTKSISELPSVVMASVFSYYIKTVAENATSFLEKNAEMTASALLQSKLLANPLFYIYLATMTGTFLIVYLIRTSETKNAWLLAVIMGTLASFTAVLASYLFLQGKDQIPTLAIGSAFTLLIGMLVAFLMRGLDYSRTEKVQYEDDEYYYYVTAIPKVRMEEQDKEVKKITEERE